MLARLLGAECPRCRQSKKLRHVELLYVQHCQHYNIHAVVHDGEGAGSNRLLATGLTERECQAAMERCVDVMAEMFGNSADSLPNKDCKGRSFARLPSQDKSVHFRDEVPG